MLQDRCRSEVQRYEKNRCLRSTGSIGTQTLEIVRTNKDIKITALAAGNNIELLEKQIRGFKPSIAAVWNEEKAAELKIKTADLDVEILSGMDGLLAAASWKDSQIVVTAIVGMIGILPTIERSSRKGILRWQIKKHL